jgi:hypothetical protein
MELPTVPGTSDEIAVEAAFAERPADVITDIRHRAELAILERDRNGGGRRLAALQRRPRELLGAADVDPVFLTSHGVPPMLVLVVRPLTPGFHVNPFDRGDRSLTIGLRQSG